MTSSIMTEPSPWNVAKADEIRIWCEANGNSTNTTRPTYDDTENSSLVLRITSILIASFGTVGNVLSFVVLVRMKPMGSAPFLTTLAITDTVHVWFSRVTFESLEIFVGYKPNLVSNVGCKIWAYLSWAPACASAWLIVAIAIERLLAVAKPFRVKTFCSCAAAYLWAVLIVALAFIVKSHTFVTYSLHEHDGQTTCYFMEHKYESLLPFCWMLTYSVIPSGIILTCNITTMRKIRQVHRKRLALTHHVTAPIATRTRRMTGMLLLVSLTFIAVSLPLTFTWWLMSLFNIDRCPVSEKILQVFRIIHLLNHSINFLLYVVSGSLFRNELKKLCGKTCESCDRVTRSRARNYPVEGVAVVGAVNGVCGDEQT